MQIDIQLIDQPTIMQTTNIPLMSSVTTPTAAAATSQVQGQVAPIGNNFTIDFSGLSLTQPTAQIAHQEMGLNGQIVDFLNGKTPMSALAIAKGVFPAETKPTAKMVNPTLYSLMNKGLVKKSDDKTPLWSVNSAYQSTGQSANQNSGALDEKIIQSLSKAGIGIEYPLKDLIADVNEKKSIVNSRLYAIEKTGRIKKVADADGKNPRWILLN